MFGIVVQFLAGARDFAFFLSIQPGSGTHSSSYLMGTEGCFPAGGAVI